MHTMVHQQPWLASSAQLTCRGRKFERLSVPAAVSGASPAPRLGNGDLAALAQLGSKPGTPFEGKALAVHPHS